MKHGSGSISVRVRYAETDQMGRAHHSHYLVWCELGRTALMREKGIPYPTLERRGVLLPVTRAHLEFRQGAGYDEELRVETRVAEVRSRTVVFAYRIERADGSLVAQARVELGCMDREGRVRRLPADVRSALEDLCGGSSG